MLSKVKWNVCTSHVYINIYVTFYIYVLVSSLCLFKLVLNNCKIHYYKTITCFLVTFVPTKIVVFFCYILSCYYFPITD